MGITVGDFLENLNNYGDHSFVIIDLYTDEILTDDPYSSSDDEMWSYIIDSVELRRNNEIRIFVRT